ncbi:MAG: TatD family hydrolase [Patescibacteria group bacterium]
MKLIDTHAHVNFNAYKDDAEAVLKRAFENDTGVINVGSEFRTSQRAVEMAERYESGVYAAIGLHPIHLSSEAYHDRVDEYEEVDFIPAVEEYDADKYQELAKSPKVVAIGEIGLDYFHAEDNKELQKKVFREQIDLACELNLPIIVHCRKAHDDIIEILRDKKKEHGQKLRGVVHCFTGNLKQAEIYTTELNFYLGWNGIITFTDAYDKVLQNIDLKYFVVETDCPYLTPIPFRGKRNEPLYVEKVAEKIAEIKGKTLQKIAEITSENARNLFNI